MIDVTLPSSARDAIKPRFRGWVHAGSAILAIPAVWILVAASQPGHLRVGALVFGLTMIFLLSVSGSYHTPQWSDQTMAILRLIDHCMIFVFVGGTYTPFLLASKGDIFQWFLPVVWLMALLGILRTIFIPDVKRWIKAGFYMMMGWMALPLVSLWVRELGWETVNLLLIGGVIYTTGGVMYAKQKPNPWPETWGYHECFHLAVVVGCAFHYWAVWRVVTPI